MAITVESTASTGFTSGNTVTITKPTGLAENDLMIAAIFSNSVIATASGWTLVAETTSISPTNIQYKIATSGDVAASNFSFTTSGSDFVGGAILRVTGHSVNELFNDSETDTVANSDGNYSFSFTGVAPIVDNQLFVACISAFDTTGSGTSSGYTINGTNPTWTEVIDDFESIGAVPIHGAVAYATQATAATVTSFTATHTGVDTNTDYGITLATLVPQIDGNGAHAQQALNTTTTAVSSSTTNPTHSQTALTATTQAVSGNVTNPTQWTNESRPSTTWTNQSRL